MMFFQFLVPSRVSSFVNLFTMFSFIVMYLVTRFLRSSLLFTLFLKGIQIMSGSHNLNRSDQYSGLRDSPSDDPSFEPQSYSCDNTFTGEILRLLMSSKFELPNKGSFVRTGMWRRFPLPSQSASGLGARDLPSTEYTWL